MKKFNKHLESAINIKLTNSPDHPELRRHLPLVFTYIQWVLQSTYVVEARALQGLTRVSMVLPVVYVFLFISNMCRVL